MSTYTKTEFESLPRAACRLRRRYVRTVKIGDKWNTYLQIDHQGFCVVEQTSRHRALWFGKMLAIALERMLAANKQLKLAQRRKGRKGVRLLGGLGAFARFL